MKKIICFLLLLGLPVVVHGGSSVQSALTCHCFKDRVYNPQEKFSADPYLLTSCFNSFLSANFHISKSRIVMLKMKDGVSSDDLLTALYVARAGGGELKSVLAILGNGEPWQSIFDSVSSGQNRADKKIFKEMGTALSEKGNASGVVINQLIQEFFKVSGKDVEALQKAGVGGREIVYLYTLERYGKSGKSVAEILAMYTEGGQSWSEIADGFGLTPKEIGKFLVTSAKSPSATRKPSTARFEGRH